MKVEKNILVAFVLNIGFSIFEIIGGIFTNSVSIISDAVHDFGDAVSIGISYFLERKSRKKPNENYTYGYVRYSVLGALITTLILVLGSGLVIYGGISRIIEPAEIDYDNMIILAVVGVVINFIAVYFTRDKSSMNQKAVNLHMLEDVLGWVVVLVGSILMKFTDISIIDPIMSIGMALFILIHALKNLKEVLEVFLEKTPNGVSVPELKEHILKVKGVIDVHHIHVWTMDGTSNFATMHLVTQDKNAYRVKEKVREELAEHGIAHATIEIEDKLEDCHDKECRVSATVALAHHHHHH